MKRALLLMALTGLNTIAVFAFQWYVVMRLGAGESTDALFAAMVVPQLMLNVLSGSLVFVLVPVLAIAQDGERNRTVWTWAVSLGVVFGILAVMLAILAPYWVPTILPGFSVEAAAQAVILVKVQLVGLVFAGLATPFNAAYQAQGKFVFPSAVSLVSSGVSLLFVIVFLDDAGVVSAAWALTIRFILQFLLQTPIGFPISCPDFRDVHYRKSLRRLQPLIAGTAYYKTEQLVDRLLASMAPSGGLSILHLAQQMYAAGSLVLVNAIAAPVVPKLSQLAAANQACAFQQEVKRALAALMVWGAVVYALIVVTGKAVFELIFGHGAFDAGQVALLWQIMVALGLVWFSGLAGHMLSTSFYATSDTVTPTRVGVIGFTVGIPLKIVGFYLYGLVGIAVATGIYATGNAVVMHAILTRRMKERGA